MSRINLRLSLCMFAALILLGCGSNGTLTSAPTIDSGVAAGQLSNGSQHAGMALYIGNKLFSDDPGQISVLHVDSQRGTLSEVGSSPFPSLPNIGAFFPIAEGKFLLYWNKQFHPQGDTPTPDTPDTSGLYRVQLGTSGEIVGTPVLVSNALNFSTAQTDSLGKYVFIENPSNKAIDVFTVNQNTGELSLQTDLGVSFSQAIQLISRTGDKLWIDAGNSDSQKRTYQTVDIDSATGKLTLDARQLTFDFKSDQLSQGYIVTSHQAVFVYQRLTTGQEMYSIFGEQNNGFAQLPVCSGEFAPLCSSAEPFFPPAGDRVIFRTPGKLWSVPFDPIGGLQFSHAKAATIDGSLEISNMIFSDDGMLLYGIDSQSARTIGFVVDDNGGLTQAPGSEVQVREGPSGSWVALALGKTQR